MPRPAARPDRSLGIVGRCLNVNIVHVGGTNDVCLLPHSLRNRRPTSNCSPRTCRSPPRPVSRAGLDDLWLWEDCFWGGGLVTAAAALGFERARQGRGWLHAGSPAERGSRRDGDRGPQAAACTPSRSVPAIGHGVHDSMAMAGASVESRLTLLAEYARAVRRLLHGEEVTMTGRYVHLRGVRLSSPPTVVPPLLSGPTVRRVCASPANWATA